MNTVFFRKTGITCTLIVILAFAIMVFGCSKSSGSTSGDNSQAGSEPARPESYLENGDIPATDPYFAVNGKSPADITGSLMVWTWDTNFFGMIQKMETIYPKITYDFVTVPGSDYMMKLQSALASGAAVPDILCAEINNVGRFYDMDISDDISKAPYNIDKEMLVPYLADIGTDDKGKFIGIPNTAAPGGLFYRRDLAQQYLGTDDPTEVSAMVTTWDDFINVCKKVTTASGGKVWGIAGLDGLIHPTVDQSSKPWREGNKLLIEENYLDSYELIKKIAEARIDGGMDEYTPAWHASFEQGNVLFYLGACWTQSFVIEVNDPNGAGRWGVASTPGGPYNWGGIWWTAYRNSKNKDAIAAWMRYEVSPQGGRNKYQMIHFYPGLNSAYSADYLFQPNEFFGGQNVTDYYLQTMQAMTVKRPVANDGTFYDAMGFYTKNLAKGESPENLVVQIENDIISQIPVYTR
ncbi:MAG: extracellular solute-binding protein [Treponema sp.]|jgi:multiple sugar transport system substrate-binding protein|nr:extracellular solute-binding protein [Treponema sp.]